MVAPCHHSCVLIAAGCRRSSSAVPLLNSVSLLLTGAESLPPERRMLMTAHTYSWRRALALAALALSVAGAEGATATPQWLRNGVIYEIYPRDFSATGDFAGITAQLDRLQHLGVNILWLMPIHPIGTVKR